MKVVTLILVAFFITGCSNLNKRLLAMSSNVATTTNTAAVLTTSPHPLKSKKDLQIEAGLMSGTWKYQRQGDDCNDTTWTQSFHENRYYKSGGSACLLADAFSVDAENWHIKNEILYITNLSPKEGDDIILKYRIEFLDQKNLVLSSGQYKYTFLK
ncbi:MAG: hypothetical protein V3U64_03615 [Cocleimonas sp.]